jgi:hypothetical protein
MQRITNNSERPIPNIIPPLILFGKLTLPLSKPKDFGNKYNDKVKNDNRQGNGTLA